MDETVGKLTSRMQRYDEDIRKEVRKHMEEKQKVRTSVKQAQKSIVVCEGGRGERREESGDVEEGRERREVREEQRQERGEGYGGRRDVRCGKRKEAVDSRKGET